jgi:hypothetical protein
MGGAGRGERASLKRQRGWFNAFWWLATVLAWSLAVALPPLGGRWPLPASFWLALLGFAAVQEVAHILLLRRLFPDGGRMYWSWAIGMPVLVVLGVWVAAMVETAAGIALGGF